MNTKHVVELGLAPNNVYLIILVYTLLVYTKLWLLQRDCTFAHWYQEIYFGSFHLVLSNPSMACPSCVSYSTHVLQVTCVWTEPCPIWLRLGADDMLANLLWVKSWKKSKMLDYQKGLAEALWKEPGSVNWRAGAIQLGMPSRTWSLNAWTQRGRKLVLWSFRLFTHGGSYRFAARNVHLSSDTFSSTL